MSTEEQLIIIVKEYTQTMTQLRDSLKAHDRDSHRRFSDQHKLLERTAKASEKTADRLDNGLGAKIQQLLDHNTAEEARRQQAAINGHPRSRWYDNKPVRWSIIGGGGSMGVAVVVNVALQLVERLTG